MLCDLNIDELYKLAYYISKYGNPYYEVNDFFRAVMYAILNHKEVSNE